MNEKALIGFIGIVFTTLVIGMLTYVEPHKFKIDDCIKSPRSSAIYKIVSFENNKFSLATLTDSNSTWTIFSALDQYEEKYYEKVECPILQGNK